MPCAERADGPWDGVRSAHAVPSHSQVSRRRLPPGGRGPWWPPKRTETPRAASKAIVEPRRSGGDVSGVRWIHKVASRSQVSVGRVPSSPPNIVHTRRVPAHAMGASARAEGEGGDGGKEVQRVPSHSHVSSKAERPR